MARSMLFGLRQKLAEADAHMRSKSTCATCGKPRLGHQYSSSAPVSGEGQPMRGGQPESRESAGLCVCEEDDDRAIPRR